MIRSESALSGRQGSAVSTLRGLGLHLRTMGALAFSHSLGLGPVAETGRVPRESRGGPWRGLGLCLGWRCGRVAVVTGEEGLSVLGFV